MTADPWTLMVWYLAGLPPTLPDDGLQGTVHTCIDAPMPEDELPFITTASELALVLGISRKAAEQRMTQRAAMAQPLEGLTP